MSTRGKTFVIVTVVLLSIFAFIREKDILSANNVMVHIDSHSMPLDRWMRSCGFELYPNLKWATVASQHGNGQSAMTVFVPFAVENNWAIWDSPEVDDSDFRDCPTSCVWVRSRDTSSLGLRHAAPCAAQAHAVLFWLPLGHPAARHDDSEKVIQSSGLVHGDRQLWLGVGTEPGMMNSFRRAPAARAAVAARLSHARFVRRLVQRHHKLRKDEPGAVSILHQRVRALRARGYPALGQQGVRCVPASGQSATNGCMVSMVLLSMKLTRVTRCCFRTTATGTTCALSCETDGRLKGAALMCRSLVMLYWIPVLTLTHYCDRGFIVLCALLTACHSVQMAKLGAGGQCELISRLPTQLRHPEYGVQRAVVPRQSQKGRDLPRAARFVRR